jgi:hypothetical protein
MEFTRRNRKFILYFLGKVMIKNISSKNCFKTKIHSWTWAIQAIWKRRTLQ